MTILSTTNEHKNLILWGTFLLFLLFQHQFIYLHFDDFGYATVNYGLNDTNVSGRSWGIGEFFNFLNWHYTQWGGRVLFYGLFSLVLSLGEVATQIIQSFIIFGIVFFSYLIIRRNEKDFFTALTIILLYGTISKAAYIDSIGWYSASAGYIWPMLFLLAGVYYNFYYYKFHTIKTIAVALVFFCAAFSQEQIAILTVSFIGIMLLLHIYKERRGNSKLTILFIFCLLGAMIEILAPGNFVRASTDPYNSKFYDMAFIDKLMLSIPNILNMNLNATLSLLYAFVLLLAGWLLSMDKDRATKIGLHVLNTVICISVFAAYKMRTDDVVIFKIFLQLIFVGVLVTEITLYLWKQNQYVLIALFHSALLSQLAMIMSPVMFPRCTLPFQLIFHIIICFMLMRLYSSGNIRITTMLIGLIFLLSAGGMYLVTKGFYSNSFICQLNRYRITESASQIRAGRDIKKIILYKLADDSFAACMPYARDFSALWVKDYYGIPRDVELIWNHYGEKNEFYDIVVDAQEGF